MGDMNTINKVPTNRIKMFKEEEHIEQYPNDIKIRDSDNEENRHLAALDTAIDNVTLKVKSESTDQDKSQISCPSRHSDKETMDAELSESQQLKFNSVKERVAKMNKRLSSMHDEDSISSFSDET